MLFCVLVDELHMFYYLKSHISFGDLGFWDADFNHILSRVFDRRILCLFDMATRLLSMTASLIVSLISWGFPLMRGISSFTIIGVIHPSLSAVKLRIIRINATDHCQRYHSIQLLAIIILPIICKCSQLAFYKENQRIRLLV